MRPILHMVILALLFSVGGLVAYADTYPIRDRYGSNDPYYNGRPYIPVPASVLYGSRYAPTYYPYTDDTYTYSDTRYRNDYRYVDDRYYYPDYSKDDYNRHNNDRRDTRRHTSSSRDPEVTINRAGEYTYAAYTIPNYPGTPNTGAGGTFNLFIVVATLITALGGILLLRNRA